MMKPCVGVLRGGPSTEYAVSLKTGQTVLEQLPSDRYETKDILIDREGRWHMRGLPMEPGRVLEQVDVVFNALHGTYGEDGGLQRFLDTHGVAYTGSGALGSALGMNKPLAKEQLRNADLRFAAHKVLERENTTEDDMRALFEKLCPPFFVKPASGGSSLATTLVSTFDELLYALLRVFEESERALVEQMVRGREVTVAVADGFRGEYLYAFPAVEIVPTKGVFFDYAEKYDGHAREVCPASFPRETTEALLNAARTVHRTLNLRDYSRSDFIVARDGIYFLEVNTLPGLTPASLVPKAIAAVGSSLPEFLDHLVTTVLKR